MSSPGSSHLLTLYGDAQGGRGGDGAGFVLADTGTLMLRYDLTLRGGNGGYAKGTYGSGGNGGAGLFLLNGGTATINDGARVEGGMGGDLGFAFDDSGRGGWGGAGLLAVAPGGTLGGSGTVGSTVVENGGVLSPGNSIGTLTVRGDLTLQAGSQFLVEADPASSNSDRVVVTGTAALAGSVMHVGPEGAFDVARQYTILQAGSVAGRFAEVTSGYDYLTADLGYTPTDVTMSLARKTVVSPGGPGRPIRFDDLAVTPNQRNTGKALETLSPGGMLVNHVLTLPVNTATNALAQLSGDTHGSIVSSLQNSGSLVINLPINQLRQNLAAPLQAGAPTAAAGASDTPTQAAALPRSGALPAWAQLTGNWRRSDSGRDGSAETDYRSTGLFVGADRAVGQGWRVGGALGYTEGKLKIDDRSSQGDISSYSAVVYGGKSFEGIGNGKLNVLGGASYTWHDIGSKRRVAIPGLSETLEADYGASTTQVFAEVGYAIAVTPRVTLEPYAGVAWSDLRRRSFTETGGIAALSGKSQNQDLTTTTLGLRASTQVQAGRSDVALRAMLGWRHAFGSVATRSTMAFQGSDAFTVTGAPVARDTALAEIGAQVAIGRNATAGVSYSGEYGGGNRDHAGMLRVNWGF